MKLLASRGLAFRKDNEILLSQSNGNSLGCLELISQFDPSYWSANICNEFINIMGQHELKSAKYYSISMDSRTNFSHVDQPDLQR